MQFRRENIELVSNNAAASNIIGFKNEQVEVAKTAKNDILLSQHICDACGQPLSEPKDIPGSSSTN